MLVHMSQENFHQGVHIKINWGACQIQNSWVSVCTMPNKPQNTAKKKMALGNYSSRLLQMLSANLLRDIETCDSTLQPLPVRPFKCTVRALVYHQNAGSLAILARFSQEYPKSHVLCITYYFFFSWRICIMTIEATSTGETLPKPPSSQIRYRREWCWIPSHT